MVIEITDANFGNEVLKSEIPVVVDFWSPWCGPCHILAPVTDKLAQEYSGKVKFCKLNVAQNHKITTKYQVMSIPLLVFFKQGTRVDSILGAVPENSIRPKLDALL